MRQCATVAVTTPAGKLVVSELEAARMYGLSLRTFQRLRLEGSGPRFIQLTGRRIGYAVTELHAWVERRTISSTSAATVAELAR